MKIRDEGGDSYGKNQKEHHVLYRLLADYGMAFVRAGIGEFVVAVALFVLFCMLCCAGGF